MVVDLSLDPLSDSKYMLSLLDMHKIWLKKRTTFSRMKLNFYILKYVILFHHIIGKT